MNILFGILLTIHGLIHLLYFGHSAKLFQLQPGMAWPDDSWAISGITGNETARLLAAGACVLAAIGFVSSGVALLASQSWWRPAVITAALFSTAVYALFWDGKMQALNAKGLIAIVINLAILVSLLVIRCPRFSF